MFNLYYLNNKGEKIYILKDVNGNKIDKWFAKNANFEFDDMHYHANGVKLEYENTAGEEDWLDW